MKIKILKIYVKRNVPRNIKVEYDKTGKLRPAWIKIRGLPSNTRSISMRVNGRVELYRDYLGTNCNLFLPVNYTKEELRKHYNKYSEIYDKYIKRNNAPATRFLLKQFALQKNAKILELGAGTGIGSIEIAKMGYQNLTLVDYSEGMLNRARKKRMLRNCKFIYKDVSNLKLKEKFDCIISIFSLGGNTYFEENEIEGIWKKVVRFLNPKGIIALMGYDYEPPSSLFRKIKSGKYEVVKDYFSKWYIGIKRQV